MWREKKWMKNFPCKMEVEGILEGQKSKGNNESQGKILSGISMEWILTMGRSLFLMWAPTGHPACRVVSDWNMLCISCANTKLLPVSKCNANPCAIVKPSTLSPPAQFLVKLTITCGTTASHRLRCSTTWGTTHSSPFLKIIHFGQLWFVCASEKNCLFMGTQGSKNGTVVIGLK